MEEVRQDHYHIGIDPMTKGCAAAVIEATSSRVISFGRYYFCSDGHLTSRYHYLWRDILDALPYGQNLSTIRSISIENQYIPRITKNNAPIVVKQVREALNLAFIRGVLSAEAALKGVRIFYPTAQSWQKLLPDIWHIKSRKGSTNVKKGAMHMARNMIMRSGFTETRLSQDEADAIIIAEWGARAMKDSHR